MRSLNRFCDDPIVVSLLDDDFYKFTMGQLIFHKHPDVMVRFSFKCRTPGFDILDYVSVEELREQFEHVRSLRISHTDYNFLLGQDEYGDRMFKKDYLKFMLGLQLPEFQIRVEENQLYIDFYGRWSEVTYWEIHCLSIVSELISRSRMNELGRFGRDLKFAEARLKLAEKIQKIKAHGGIVFSDFGTRRRFSAEWQDYVVSVLTEEFPKNGPFEENPQFRGTSNTYLAQKYGLLPMGSRAHELDMVYTGIYHEEDERQPLYSLSKSLDDWEEEYGLDLSLALPDTYGSDFFFKNVFTDRHFHEWKGSRQDSGDPFTYGEKRIKELREHGVDSRKKVILFSDDLNVMKMLQLHDRFAGRIKPTFGWGTNLTNDFGFKAHSTIVKVAEAAGHSVAKLSDNIQKATGPKEAIERMIRLTGYRESFSEQPVH